MLIHAAVCVTVTLLFETIDKTSINKIIFLRLGAVGDLLVSTAALAEVCRFFPQAKISVVGPKIWTQILHPKQWPQVEQIFVVEKNSKWGTKFFPNNSLPNEFILSFPHLLWKSPGAPEQERVSEWSADFDLIVNLRLESTRFAWRTRKLRYRLGTAPWPLQFLYSHWSPWLGRDPIFHERDRLLEVLEAPFREGLNFQTVVRAKEQLRFKQSGFKNIKVDPYKVLHPQQNPNSLSYKWRERGLPSLLPEHQRRARTNQIFINPTASRWEKAWHPEKFRAFALELRRTRSNFEVVILGAPNETEWLQKVAGSDFAIVQPKNFWELQLELSGAAALIANCSSSQFFANTTETPVCTLHGRTFPARWGPLRPIDLSICGKVPPNPPVDLFLEDFAAYESLEPESVLRQVLPWLDRLPKPADQTKQITL